MQTNIINAMCWHIVRQILNSSHHSVRLHIITIQNSTQVLYQYGLWPYRWGVHGYMSLWCISVCVFFTDRCGQASNVSFLLQLGYEHLSTLWYCELQAGIFSKQKGDQHTLRLNYCIIELLKQTQTVLCSGPAYEDSLSDKNWEKK